MKPTIKCLILRAMLVMGLLLTHGCGQQGDDGYGVYKAENTLDKSDNPTTVTNTAASPAEMAVGDIYTITFSDSETGSINFEGTDHSEEFILAVTSLDNVQADHTVQLSNETAPFTMKASLAAGADRSWDGWSAREALDQQLRGAEMELSQGQVFRKASPKFNAASAMKTMVLPSKSAPAVGDVESFKVLSGLSSLSSYATVEGKIKCIGEKVIFYVDQEIANSSDLTDADVIQLCTNFDKAAAFEVSVFGEPSDVNDDGHFAVLMTPQVNRLGAMGGGIITGFFFANDLYTGENSNQREILYTMVPDSNGRFGMSIPKNFAMSNLLPAVLPHEFQHAISYNQKVFIAKGQAEDDWLNEALSHFAEDLTGYGQENPSRIEAYFNNTSQYGPVTESAPDLAERGASYLFLRYLYEQSQNGDQFLRNLLQSNLTGVANLETAFAGTSSDFDQLSEFLLRWTATMAISSYNLSIDPRFSYKDRVKNAETGNWHGVCLNCDTDDGRGTILNGVNLSTYYGVSQLNLQPTATEYQEITSFPQEIKLAAKNHGTHYGAVLIRFK